MLIKRSLKTQKIEIKWIFVTVSLALFVGPSSYCGEILRLKSGDVPTASFSIDTSKIGPQRPSTGANGERFYIVQFNGPVTEEQKSQLREAGLKLGSYLPDDAFLAKGSNNATELAKITVSGIRAILPYQAEWKLSPEISNSFHTLSDPTFSVIVTLVDPADLPRIEREIREIPRVSSKVSASREIIVHTPLSEVSELAKIEGIEWIQMLPIFVTLDFKVDPVDDPGQDPHPEITGFESGTKVMNFDAAWSRGFTGEGQFAAMADTGVDTGDLVHLHPDLSAVIKGYPIGMGSSSWEDPQGHGSHVCGSIVGNGKMSDSKIRGGAFGAKFVVESLWSPIVDNLSFDPDFNVLLGKVYQDGVRIHSNSWGNPQNPGSYDVFAEKVDAYLWDNPEMLVLFAAGNDGEDKDGKGRIDHGSINTPATAKNVLTVGASKNYLLQGGIQKPLGELRGGDHKWGSEPFRNDTLSNNPNGIAPFSSRGPTLDGRIKPEILAPGTNIVSVRSQHPKAESLWGEFNKYYVYAGGTSMASPLTAGAATVVREFLVKKRKIENPTGALVKAVLMHTAKDIFPGQYGTGQYQEILTKRPNVDEGYGRVDMDKATALSEDTLVVDERQGVGLEEEKTYSVQVDASGSLHATLSYTDAPGSAAASRALVNELDILVQDSSGKKIADTQDNLNNSKTIELEGVEAGSYSVIIRGVNVPSGKDGKQSYALIISH